MMSEKGNTKNKNYIELLGQDINDILSAGYQKNTGKNLTVEELDAIINNAETFDDIFNKNLSSSTANRDEIIE